MRYLSNYKHDLKSSFSLNFWLLRHEKAAFGGSFQLQRDSLKMAISFLVVNTKYTTASNPNARAIRPHHTWKFYQPVSDAFTCLTTSTG
jgi:hypothetical protein